MADNKIEVENVNTPGRVTRVDADKYRATRLALLAILPESAPGLTQAEMRERIVAGLPQALFPGGDKSMWWTKCVQLDLEAKGIVVREEGKPLRWHREPGSDA